MPKKKGAGLSAIREQERMQEEIRQKFGEEALQEARVRLCSKCYRGSCAFLPIVTDGKDCPYFEERQAKK